MPMLSADELRSRVIPVIDVLSGHAVRAVRGRRNQYRPLESVLFQGSDPVDLAKVLFERFGFQEIYVADLDALQGSPTQFDVVRRIVESPVRSLLDLGIGLPEAVTRARRELPSANVRFVLPTEASPGVDSFRACIDSLGDPTRAALGLDYLRGAFRTKGVRQTVDQRLHAAEPEVWIEAALQAGVPDVVALDLDRVGSEQGFAWPVGLEQSPDIRRFRRKISGGGIRSPEDLLDALAKGCDAVLVGSALHDGRIASALFADGGGRSER